MTKHTNNKKSTEPEGASSRLAQSIKSIKKFFASTLLFGRHKNGKTKQRDGQQDIDEYILSGPGDVTKTSDESGALLESVDREIMRALYEMRDLRVSEIMVPKTEIISAKSDITVEKLKEIFVTKKLTRMPVYKKDLDDIIGFIHVKDFLAFLVKNDSKDFTSIIRPVLYVPRSVKCLNLFLKMKMERTHIAVVLDEYGGTDGIVTINHIIESMVGDINDEHDAKVSEIEVQKIDENTYIIDPKISLQDMAKQFEKLDFLSDEDGDYETLGGFILSHLGHMPVKGEKFIHPLGVEIEILDTTPRKIKKTKLKFVKEKN